MLVTMTWRLSTNLKAKKIGYCHRDFAEMYSAVVAARRHHCSICWEQVTPFVGQQLAEGSPVDNNKSWSMTAMCIKFGTKVSVSPKLCVRDQLLVWLHPGTPHLGKASRSV